jgi:hypothetical protein
MLSLFYFPGKIKNLSAQDDNNAGFHFAVFRNIRNDCWACSAILGAKLIPLRFLRLTLLATPSARYPLKAKCYKRTRNCIDSSL